MVTIAHPARNVEDIHIRPASAALPPAPAARQQVARFLAAVALADGESPDAVPSELWAAVYLVTHHVEAADGPFLARWRRAVSVFPALTIEDDGTSFRAVSASTGEVYHGSAIAPQSCTCPDYKATSGTCPCKHILAAWRTIRRGDLARYLERAG